MNEDTATIKRLLEEAVMVFEAKGAAYLQRAGVMERIHEIGDWAGVPDVSVPLDHRGSTLGRLTLGIRRDGRPFDDHDREVLAEYATSVAAVISLGGGKTA
jgi:uncharacterized protein (DUF1330 family)